MKKLLLLTLSIAAAAFSYGQCTPNTDFGDMLFGVAPDTIVNFVSGEVNSMYYQQIDVKIPAEASGFTVDSAQVLSIEGLPEGLTLECGGTAVSPCTFLPGIGCAFISGIPTQGGNFNLTIILQVYAGFIQLPFTYEGYKIFIEGGTSGIESNNNLGFKMGNAIPNPAHLSATISVESKQSGMGEFRVFDLVGKEVFLKNVRLNQGSNKITYNTSELPEGVYIYRLDAFGETKTSRLVIVH